MHPNDAIYSFKLDMMQAGNDEIIAVTGTV